MTNEERLEFKALIVEVIEPMFQNSDNAHKDLAKDIKVLFKQSAEHYSNKDKLEERLANQVHECQLQTNESSTKQGERIEEISTRVTRLEERLSNNRQNITNIIVIIGIIASIVVNYI